MTFHASSLILLQDTLMSADINALYTTGACTLYREGGGEK